jgi:hypothetical protein
LLRSLIQFLSKGPWFGILWTLLILVACSWPGKSIPDAPVTGFDKVVHIGLFAGWITLWLLAYPHKANLLVALGIAYGLALEVYQQLLPFDRTFDWLDAIADAAGVIIGLLFTTFVLNRYRQRLY